MEPRTYHWTRIAMAAALLGVAITPPCMGVVMPTCVREQTSTRDHPYSTATPFRWDQERAWTLYGDHAPIRVVQVVDTANRQLVANKPTVIRAFVCGPHEAGAPTADTFAAELYVDGQRIPIAPRITSSRSVHDSTVPWTIDFGSEGGFCPAPGPHLVEVRFTCEGRHIVLQRTIHVDFAVPQRQLTIVTVPVHVRELIRTRRPRTEALLRSHRFVEAVFPVDHVKVIREDQPYIIPAGLSRSGAAEGRRQRTALALRLVSQGLSAHTRDQLARARANGNIAVIVGVAPDIPRLLGGRPDENIHGFAVPFAGICIVKADRQIEFTVAHEIGHLMPLPLHDDYRHGDDTSSHYAKTETEAWNTKNCRRQSRRDNAGVYIGASMGGFNVGYRSADLSALPFGQPVESRHADVPSRPIRGFMGACGTMWATSSEYARLYVSFAGATPRQTIAAQQE